MFAAGNIPQGLKPAIFWSLFGPAEAVPFYRTPRAKIRQTLSEGRDHFA
jgi:hypothetical protein